MSVLPSGPGKFHQTWVPGCFDDTVTDLQIHGASVRDIDPITLYRILALRQDVFVVEQDCAYPDLDGRDLEDDARLLWVHGDDGVPIATLRLLVDADGSARIGRVATITAKRSAGVAGQLLAHALELVADRDVVLDSQVQLEGWYARLGFVRTGDPFAEDGIDHVPMRLSRS